MLSRMRILDRSLTRLPRPFRTLIDWALTITLAVVAVLAMHERIIDHINGHDGIRWATFDEIADDFAKRSPRGA